MGLEKQKLIMKRYVNPQFGYFPLALMLRNRTLNNRINMIHERVLRIMHYDKVYRGLAKRQYTDGASERLTGSSH